MDDDDLETNINQDDQEEGTSDLFELYPWDIPNLQGLIAGIATSEQFLYIITKEGDIIRFQGGKSETLRNLYSLPTNPKNPPSNAPEKLTKIFTDRKGNHAIIKHGGRMYYFNSGSTSVKELPALKGIEVYAVGFDESNANPKSTGEILISDFENRIYSYTIEFEQGKVKDNIQELFQLPGTKDKIYGLQVSLFIL